MFLPSLQEHTASGGLVAGAMKVRTLQAGFCNTPASNLMPPLLILLEGQAGFRS